MKNDLDLYEREAHAWWDGEARTFRSLRSIKAFHLAELDRQFGAELAHATIVDLGCGGGLLSIPLAERGARVTGVDRSAGSLGAAELAARRSRVADRCHFVVADLCDTGLPSKSYDIALLSDVIEHLESPAAALREAARLLKPGGRLFVNTLNRTLRARLLAVFLAERLGYVPRGTHDHRLFLKPTELRFLAGGAGLDCDRIFGEAPQIGATLRTGALQMRGGKSIAVSYSAFFTKRAALISTSKQVEADQ